MTICTVTQITRQCEISSRGSGGLTTTVGVALKRKGLLFRRREFLLEQTHFGEELIAALRLGFIHFADRKADMHHHVVARRGLRNEIQAHLPHDASELHPSGARHAEVFSAQYFSGYRQAHGISPQISQFSYLSDASGCDVTAITASGDQEASWL